jgi:shikimate dehydrogenase
MIDTYAVMGHPIAHSKSPSIHIEFAKQTHQNIRYFSIEAPLNQFSECVKLFQQQHGKGLNITSPFKQQAFELVSYPTVRASLAKSVNTIQFLENGESLGDNTDGVGFIRDISVNHRIALAGKNILILGAGGAIRGILGPLCEHRPKRVLIANRTPKKAIFLASEFSQYQVIEATGLDAIRGTFDLIVNAISSTLPYKEILSPALLSESTFCYDMIYREKLTPFLQWAVAKGVKAFADGIGMLVEQAAESFFLWRGVRPQTQPVIACLTTGGYGDKTTLMH